jgi:glutathione S-transferase
MLDRAYALLEDRIGDGWLAGPEFSLAECAAAPSLFYARVVRRWDEPALPRLTRYFERLTAHPSVARVIDEARPYRELFPLPWPEYAA